MQSSCNTEADRVLGEHGGRGEVDLLERSCPALGVGKDGKAAGDAASHCLREPIKRKGRLVWSVL